MTLEEFTKQYQEASLKLLGKEASAALAEAEYNTFKALLELTECGEGNVEFVVSDRNNNELTWEFTRK